GAIAPGTERAAFPTRSRRYGTCPPERRFGGVAKSRGGVGASSVGSKSRFRRDATAPRPGQRIGSGDDGRRRAFRIDEQGVRSRTGQLDREVESPSSGGGTAAQRIDAGDCAA